MAMSEYDANLDALRELHDAARTAVGGVDADARKPYRQQFLRLERVLAYTGVVLASTDGWLLSTQTHANLTGALQSVRDNIAASPQTADDYSSALLVAVSALPLAEGKLTAQTAAEAAQKFARSSRARLAALTRQVNERKAELTALGQTLEEEKEGLGQLVAERRADSEALVAATRAQLEELEQRIESATTEQAEVFRSAQEERAGQFSETVAEFEKQLGTAVEDAEKRVGELIEEIARKDQDATNLLAALGIKGTAGRWAQEAQKERTTANRWRWVTVAVVIAAAAVALLAARADSVDDPEFVSKILISVALGGLATYAAKQSGRHRNREERARRLELELAAFGPFIEPLPTELQHEQRSKMVDRTFGQPAAEAAPDGGPSLLGQIAPRQGATPPDDLSG
jgi:hypothetical protein